MATIDVGTVAGISIGTTPPSNPAIIWYDTTDKLHKNYDASLGQWIPMSQAIVSEIGDFNDLINKANLPGGLPIAAFYNVLKRDADAQWNTMVWVVGQTRIQYVDKLNNIIVEDLAGQGTTTQYVASTNYFFDNIVATFDQKTSKLNYTFQQLTDNPALEDVLYGMRVINNIPTLVKRTVKSLLSNSSKNSLGFVNGLYFDFSAAMNGVIVSEQTGDTQVPGYKQYKADYVAIEKAFADVSKIINDWQNGSSAMIFGAKLIEVNPVTATVAAPQDLTTQDDLKTALNKIQGWYNRLKLSTGMSLSPAYAPAANKSRYPQAGDTVEQAIGILQKFLQDFNGQATAVTVGGNAGDFPASPNPSYQIKPTDNLYQAVAKIVNNLASLFGGGVDDVPYVADSLVRTQSIRPQSVTQPKLGVDVMSLINNGVKKQYPVNVWEGTDPTNWFIEPGMFYDAATVTLPNVEPSISENYENIRTDCMWDFWVRMPNNTAKLIIHGDHYVTWLPVIVYQNTIGSPSASSYQVLINCRFMPLWGGERGYWLMTKYILNQQS
jgi:hypothetical protein